MLFSGHRREREITFHKTVGKLTLLAVSTALLAQTPPGIEVATVKAVDPVDHVTGFTRYPSPKRFESRGTLLSLLRRAFGFQEYQIQGAPSWANKELFDVVMLTDIAASPEQRQELLRALVVDRFRLAFRKVKVKGSVYVATGEPGGIRMAVATEDKGVSSGATFIRGTMTVGDLCKALPSLVGRPVLDESGTTSRYMVDLKWAAEDDPTGPSLFTAIHEQLGLRLQATKRPTDQLVIDRAERPLPN